MNDPNSTVLFYELFTNGSFTAFYSDGGSWGEDSSTFDPYSSDQSNNYYWWSGVGILNAAQALNQTDWSPGYWWENFDSTADQGTGFYYDGT